MRYTSMMIAAAIVPAMTGCHICDNSDPYNRCDRTWGESGDGGSWQGDSGSSGTISTTGGAGEAGGYVACAAGAGCLPGLAHCCNLTEALTCVNGVYAHQAWCNGEYEMCDSIGGGCSCPPGAKRCIPEAPTSIQTCLPSGGTYQFQAEPCGAFEYCNTALDQCAACLDECLVGDIRCSADSGIVEECKKVGSPGCNAAVWTGVYSCVDKHMFCKAPSFSVDTYLQYCVNECGGRGIPLQGSECSVDPQISCSVLQCVEETGTLHGDHVACLPAGASCTQDNQCASCSCSNGGYCVGNTPKPCPTPNPCPW